ncbi:GNAT family N-acetyltransferase [Vampirovibrio sp.]|uniref:GNAT family N-acetyltransferase n=1 Tax=Vampirovibrio sp. TaxID=2717857 RepID=UPI0035939704
MTIHTSTLQYRLARPADSEALIELILAMAWESEQIKLNPKTLQAGVMAVFNHPQRGTYWVIEQESQLIGCTLITEEWSDWNNAPYWWIQSLYIQPPFRGQGMFEGLLAVIEQAAKSQGAPELRLYVAQNNQRAIRVYERTGFEADHYRCMTRALT